MLLSGAGLVYFVDCGFELDESFARASHLSFVDPGASRATSRFMNGALKLVASAGRLLGVRPVTA